MIKFNLGLETAALLVSVYVLGYGIVKKKVSKHQHTLYFSMVLSLILASICSITSTSLEHIGNGKAYYYPIMYWTQIGFFIFHTCLAPIFVSYVLELNGALLNKKKSFYWGFFFPLIIGEVLVVLTPIFNLIFKYEGFHYVRQPSALALYVIAFIYIVFGINYSLQMTGSLPKRKSRHIIFFVMLTVVGVLLQAITGIAAELLVESIMMIGFLVITEDEEGLFDAVTGLYNKTAFADENRRMISSNQPYHIIDVHIHNYARLTGMDMKSIDELMREIAIYLSSIYDSRRIYFHDIGSFALVLYREEEQVLLEGLLHKIKDRFEDTWDLSEKSLKISPVIYSISVPENASTLADLLAAVELEYQFAHEQTLVLRSHQLSFIKHEREIKGYIEEALEKSLFKVYYQPIYNTKTNTITAAEALIRLQDPKGGFISPEFFIPIAERSGMINEIGEYVFEEVCRFIHENDLKKLGLDYIEINLSVGQLISSDLLENFTSIMKRYEVTSDQINLEITETFKEGEEELFDRNRRELEAAGFKFSLDDFGTGYSNIVRLLNIPFVNIKIDKSILWDVYNNHKTEKVYKELVKVLVEMGYDVIQEGVENKEQLEFAIESGANLIQGYHFSRPVPAHEFIEYVEDFNGGK